MALRELTSGKIFKAVIAVAAVALACFFIWRTYGFYYCGNLFAAETMPLLSAADCPVGSYVKFGRYPQNDSEKPEPIEWQVLENDGKTALLFSRYGLDSQPFDHEYKYVPWRDCDLRQWLNGPFFYKAFTRKEQLQIKDNIIITGDNEEFNMQGCGETRDRIFCLSIDEAEKYFDTDEKRKRMPTKFAESSYDFTYVNGCWFWLRNPGAGICFAAVVSYGGSMFRCGLDVNRSLCVVPALRINLEN